MSIADRGRRAFRRMTPQARLDAVQQQLAAIGSKVATQADAQRRQRDRIKAQGERIRAQGERIKSLEATVRAVNGNHVVLQQQLASMEVRMEQLESRLEPAPDSTEQERVQARNLLDEMREEHRRIRTRFAVVTRYEERIRRLESVLEPTADQ